MLIQRNTNNFIVNGENMGYVQAPPPTNIAPYDNGYEVAPPTIPQGHACGPPTDSSYVPHTSVNCMNS